MADFPTSKKTWADLVDNVSPANSSDINSAYAEITAIEDAFLTDSTSLNASTVIHGFLPKLSGSSDEYMNGIGEWGTPATGGAGAGAKYPCDGRLTLESGVAVSITDQTDKTALYFTPYKGDQIGLYDGSSAWETLTFAELSLDISAYTASKPYDIWIYNNAGTAVLDSTVWTNATARATALALQDGVYVKAGTTTHRYLGTIYMDDASKCQDSVKTRYVWNYYNRVPKKIKAIDTTGSWTYTTETWRPANNNTTNGIGRVSFVIGVQEVLVKADSWMQAVNTDANIPFMTSIALDVTNSYTGTDLFERVYGAAGAKFLLPANFSNYVSVGFHFLQRMEISAASGTTTWYGKSTGDMQTGLLGELLG